MTSTKGLRFIVPEQRKSAAARPALAKPSNYKYSFPQSSRVLGGGLSVGDAAERLLFASRLHFCLARTIAGALIWIGPFELKVELAHHLYQHADACRHLRQRLRELRVSEMRLNAPLPGPFNVLSEELLLSDGAIEFIAGCARVVKQLLDDTERYAADTDSLLDQPSLRVLRVIRIDLADMIAWVNEVEAAALKAGDDPNTVASAKDHAGRILVWLRKGEEEDPSFPLRRSQKGPYTRPIACNRDDRFPVFTHTRRYDASDFLDQNKLPTRFEAQRLELLRVQRDELDAIETFANIFFDLGDQAEFDLLFLLGRLVWDEARHAEMGQRNLERLGFEPFSVPCGVIGINVRSPLPPEASFAQISIFGELSQIGELKRLSEACRKKGDLIGSRSFDFTHADELMHLREGRKWLRRFAQAEGISLDELAERARQLAISRLREEGVLGEDYSSEITPAELAALIGE